MSGGWEGLSGVLKDGAGIEINKERAAYRLAWGILFVVMGGGGM